MIKLPFNRGKGKAPASDDTQGVVPDMPAPEELHTPEVSEAPKTPDAPKRKGGGLFAKLSKKGGKQPASKDATGKAAKFTTSDDILIPEEGCVTFGGKPAAIGLRWEKDKYTNIRSFARTIEEQDMVHDGGSRKDPIKYDAYLPISKLGWVGLASSQKGQKIGMKILITMVEPALVGENWIGIFKIGDGNAGGWWLAAFVNGDPVLDIFTADKEIVTQEYMAFMDVFDGNDLDSRIAPHDFGIPNSTEIAIHKVINFHRGEKLHSMSPVRDYGPKAVLGMMLIGAMFGGWKYYENMKEEERQELIRLKREAQARINLRPQDHPWYYGVDANEFIETCMEKIDTHLKIVPGWYNQAITCSVKRGKAEIVTGFQRDRGNMAMLRAAFDPSLPAPVLGKSGVIATWSLPFEMAYRDDIMDTPPWPETELPSRLQERFQLYPYEIAIRESKGNKPAAPRNPVFNSHDIHMSFTAGMPNVGDIVANIPALVPEDLVYTPETGKFDVTMRVYHPVKLPQVKTTK